VVAGVHENVRIFVQGTQIQWFTRMHGTEADLPEIRSGWVFPHGRFLRPGEVERSEQVMVLGRVVSDRLFGAGVNPVGHTILLWHQPFKVIGVVGSRSWATQPAPGDDQFDAIYVPVSTIDRLLNLSKLNSVSVTTQSVGDTKRISKAIITLLRQRHHITAAMPDDFNVTSVAEQVLGKGLPPDLARAVTGNIASVDQLTVEQLSTSLSRTNWTMLALLAGVATVSLLVGGIGVMNLLLLSVTQRTREVGLRIALGARRSDIAAQFVFEAILLSVIGGVFGVLCGVAASGSLEKFFQWSAVVSPFAAGFAVLVAVLLGIVFGAYPAQRAAQLDPIEALRHE
jgi:putative ABC transport system permease protein